MVLPIGPPAPPTPATTPTHVNLHGRYTSVLPMSTDHSASLFTHVGGKHNVPRWTYMTRPGFPTLQSFEDYTAECIASADPLFFSILTGPASDPASEAAGIVSYLSIVPDHLRIEIGSVILGDKLARTRAATEAFFLMIQHAFDLGYHRVEWKANNLNAPSRSAAARLGFVFEGVFRNHMVVKGHMRDTAWFSITSDEWPGVKKGFDAWLSESNFDADGKQLRTLKDCREN
ncbi:related to GNAT family acetyltransferase [Cephalotrichum gorgonifer]|uniref:Related to GNAT family acetyltransferase n=1 Tax=Cephalotrichum gorgonifer TaxID=2041049 RepID=A0AAE8N4Y8_9PEZI|nr:related to GNAT family acetyltransferase [Cephalotrichum gorgonifer]